LIGRGALSAAFANGPFSWNRLEESDELKTESDVGHAREYGAVIVRFAAT
jgi:hypothetical protein